MLPRFPEFKPLELSDRSDIEKITRKHPPYSDFNFTSLWSWDVEGGIRVSELDGGLAVRFSDYVTGEPFYSFIGAEPNAAAEKLLALSTAQGIVPRLKLVPEFVASALDPQRFKVEEDRDNFDYVLSVERLLPHDGTKRKLSTRRKLINEFKKRKDFRFALLDVKKPEVQRLMLDVFERWEGEQGVEKGSVEHLKHALERLFKIGQAERILALGVYLNNILVGYSINEVTWNGYVVGHFQQGNVNVFGALYALMMQEVGERVHHLGSRYINIEQDLGIAGLREWKESYRPDSFLKKYVVSPVDRTV